MLCDKSEVVGRGYMVTVTEIIDTDCRPSPLCRKMLDSTLKYFLEHNDIGES